MEVEVLFVDFIENCDIRHAHVDVVMTLNANVILF